MATQPTNTDTEREAASERDAETEREEKLRRNSSFEPGDKAQGEDPMHADSWSGGSINPEAKKVARGEAPANQERGENSPPEADYELPTEATRPWAPKFQDADDAEVDAAGRPKGNDRDGEPRQAPHPAKQDDEPGGRPKVTTW